MARRKRLRIDPRLARALVLFGMLLLFLHFAGIFSTIQDSIPSGYQEWGRYINVRYSTLPSQLDLGSIYGCDALSGYKVVFTRVYDVPACPRCGTDACPKCQVAYEIRDSSGKRVWKSSVVLNEGMARDSLFDVRADGHKFHLGFVSAGLGYHRGDDVPFSMGIIPIAKSQDMINYCEGSSSSSDGDPFLDTGNDGQPVDSTDEGSSSSGSSSSSSSSGSSGSTGSSSGGGSSGSSQDNSSNTTQESYQPPACPTIHGGGENGACYCDDGYYLKFNTTTNSYYCVSLAEWMNNRADNQVDETLQETKDYLLTNTFQAIALLGGGFITLLGVGGLIAVYLDKKGGRLL